MAIEPSFARGRARGASRVAAGASSIVEPFEVCVARSIEAFDRREWDALSPDELETWDYLRAVERAELRHCELVYFAVRSGGRLVVAVPAFVGRRALGEPWRGEARGQWRRSRERMLVLGSPLSAARRVAIVPNASARDRVLLGELTVRAVSDEAERLGVGVVLPSDVATGPPRSLRRFGSPRWLDGGRERGPARLSLPGWSFSDYVSSLDEPLRGRLLIVCAQAAPYERDWCVDLDADLAPMLALCAEAGLEELGRAYFEKLLGPGVRASCLVVRLDGKIAGFSLLLHDARVMREVLTVASRRVKTSVARAVIWLETIRYCLECGIGRFESPSELSFAVAGSRAQNPSMGSSLSTAPSAAVPPDRSSVAT